MTGAALHAARGALAAGAGLVKLVAAKDTIEAARASLPDVLTVESALGPELEPEAAEALEWADALVVGPGLGREPPRAQFLQAVLARRPIPTVLDADALILFHGSAERPVVLTPHLGEFRAQFGDELADTAANDRWAAAAKAAQKVKGTVLLKGVPTVIADLRGPIHVVASGNPGLATGGSGDPLARLIRAVLARGRAGAGGPPPGAPARGGGGGARRSGGPAPPAPPMCWPPCPRSGAPGPKRSRSGLRCSPSWSRRRRRDGPVTPPGGGPGRRVRSPARHFRDARRGGPRPG